VRISSLSEHRALIVDTSDALFVDYDFSRHAFAPLFADPALEEQRRGVIFQLAASDQHAFFHGIVKYLKVPLGEYAKSKESFISANHTCKTIGARVGPIDFVGQLSSLEREVLRVINELCHAEIG